MKAHYRRIRPLLAVTILALVALLIFFSATRLVSFAISGETNADLLSSVLYPCESPPIATSSKMAILRLDDVQAYAWADIALRMMDDARERDIPLVLGVIPKGLRDDASTYTYLREHRCFHEIAQHGWDHNSETAGESPEFRGVPYDEALDDIERGKAVLEALARERMTTFIPPNNEMSVETYRAVEKLQIPIVSSEGENRYDFAATTFDYGDDRVTSVERMMEDCRERTASSDLCVIMLHPQEFATDGVFDNQKYQLYLDLLEELRKENYSIVRFKDLVDFDRSYSSWQSYLFPSLFRAIESQ